MGAVFLFAFVLVLLVSTCASLRGVAPLFWPRPMLPVGVASQDGDSDADLLSMKEGSVGLGVRVREGSEGEGEGVNLEEQLRLRQVGCVCV